MRRSHQAVAKRRNFSVQLSLGKEYIEHLNIGSRNMPKDDRVVQDVVIEKIVTAFSR